MNKLTDLLLRRIAMPEWIIRREIRRQNRERLDWEKQKLASPTAREDFIKAMDESPIFLSTASANQQHYEVPAEFFRHILGHRMKYSSCYWNEETKTLSEAEDVSLRITCENAQIEHGENILELGCGWGSLTLYMAERFPNCRITAVSNSHSQREFISQKAAKRGFKNIEVITANVGEVTLSKTFDRVVSVEMFEHARNYRALLKKISGWLKPDGKLFVHIFVHRDLLYSFNPGESWMADYFFKDGLMPSYDIFDYFTDDFVMTRHQAVPGHHYQKTAEAWHSNHCRHRDDIIDIFSRVYGKAEKLKYWNYWRIFFLACSELFGYDGGKEWLVGHYLLEKR